MLVAQWLALARKRLDNAGIESPALEAQMLAAHALGVDRSFVLTHPDASFPDNVAEPFLTRREHHEPLAYILGWREFYGRRFVVGRGVLVPRHETETLIEAALMFLRSRETADVLDLGTGSGCIAITLKLEIPQVRMTAVDISVEALEIARENAALLQAEVRFMESDLFSAVSDERFDLIVTNPPYVGLHEALPPEVREHEPHEALYSGHTGLEFYEELANSAAGHLRDTGKLMMEVGYRQAEHVANIFESAGWYVESIQADLSGTDRVVTVRPTFV